MPARLSPLFFLSLLFLGLLDGVLKFFVHRFAGDFFLISPNIFRFELYKNFGIAFDLPLPQELTLFFTACIAVYLFYLLISSAKGNPIVSFGALTALFGAASNFFDRVLNGYVTDYLIFFHRSAINIADILILLGILIIVIYTGNRSHSK